MSNQLLTGLVMGEMLSGGDRSAEIDANTRAYTARSQADTAIELLKREREEHEQTHEARQGWRQYAARLRTNLEARKMSEATLLEALKKESVNHPLATEEGFKEHFQAELAKQYGVVEMDADHQAFDAREEATMLKQRTEGRGAVE
ncbi:hypothetical protein UT4_17460 [Ferrigenium sp. UT4]